MNDASTGDRMNTLARLPRSFQWAGMGAILLAAGLAGCATSTDSTDSKGGDERPRTILEEEGKDPEVVSTSKPRLPSLPAGAALRQGKKLTHFAPASWGSLPAWQARDYTVVWNGFLRNCQAVMERGVSPGARSAVVAPGPWRDVCVAAFDPARAPSPSRPDAIRQFLESWLQPWTVMAAGKPAVNTVTGYYEPLVRASRQRTGAYQWPLYAVPDDMLTIDLGSQYPELAGKRVRGKLEGKRVVPYDSRAEIERPGRQPDALVWVDDPVDAFFLQVQGSGRAELPGGRIVRLAYADQNGHQYASIGRWLVDKGELTLAQASMQNIREWARRNPSRVQEMLNANPSVIFFKEEPVHVAGEGPRGAFNVPLTAEHSIAVDPQFVPLGSPVMLSTTYPGTGQPLNRLVFAQDTGSAIKGAGRADFYWGFGEEAGAIAGRMKQEGRMWVLWPKAAGAPAADR